MTIKINQVSDPDATPIFGGAIRYDALQRSRPSVAAFKGPDGQGRLFIGPGQDRGDKAPDGNYNVAFADARANLFDIDGVFDFHFERYNYKPGLVGSDTDDIPGPYPFPTDWPKKRQALRLPRKVRFLYINNGISQNDSDNLNEIVSYMAMVETVKENLKDVKNLYVSDMTGLFDLFHIRPFTQAEIHAHPDLFTGPADGGIFMDAYHNCRRWLACCTPRLEHVKTSPFYTGKNFLGGDVLNIIFWNAYNAPVYYNMTEWAKVISRIPLTGLGGFGFNSLGAFVSHNLTDIDYYRAAYPLFRRSNIWLYHTQTCPDGDIDLYIDTDSPPTSFMNLEGRRCRIGSSVTTGIFCGGAPATVIEECHYELVQEDPPIFKTANFVVSAVDVSGSVRSEGIGQLEGFCSSLSDVGVQYKGLGTMDAGLYTGLIKDHFKIP